MSTKPAASLVRLHFWHCSVRWSKLVARVDYDRCAMCKARVDAHRVESLPVVDSMSAMDGETILAAIPALGDRLR